MDSRNGANPNGRVVLERRRPGGLLPALAVAVVASILVVVVLGRTPAQVRPPAPTPPHPSEAPVPSPPATPTNTDGIERAGGIAGITIVAVPEDAHPHLGERVWIDVAVTNHSSTDYALTTLCASPIAVDVSDPTVPAAGPSDRRTPMDPLIRSDGEPLRWLLERQRLLPVSVTGFEVDQTGKPGSSFPGDGCGDVEISVALLAHSSITSRQSVDLSTAGPLPPTSTLALRVGVEAASPATGATPITSSIPLTVTDTPDRFVSWTAAVTAAGEDRRVLDWVMAQQGSPTDAARGVRARASYRSGAWEVWLTSTSGTRLRVRTAAGSGAVLEVREIPDWDAPRDDPDATFTTPTIERVLL